MRSLLGVVALSVLLGAPAARAEAPNISIKEYAFSPVQLTVAAGTQVTWTNYDQVPHTIVEEGKKFHSPALDTNDSYSFVLTQPGTYRYFCSLHPQMVGTITVVKGG
jgi:plastocyanin